MSKYTEQSAVERLTRNRVKVGNFKIHSNPQIGNRLLGAIDYLVNHRNYILIRGN